MIVRWLDHRAALSASNTSSIKAKAILMIFFVESGFLDRIHGLKHPLSLDCEWYCLGGW